MGSGILVEFRKPWLATTVDKDTVGVAKRAYKGYLVCLTAIASVQQRVMQAIK